MKLSINRTLLFCYWAMEGVDAKTLLEAGLTNEEGISLVVSYATEKGMEWSIEE